MSLLHSSGLGVTGGCQYENEYPNGGADAPDNEDPYGCTIQGHFQRKFNELGMSSVVVEYEHQANLNQNGDVAEGYGVTFQQNIDSSALQIFMKYAQLELERDTQLNGFDDLDLYTIGTRLRF